MNTAATRAAIRRASQHARNAMTAMDADTVQELLKLYTDAAEQVRSAIRARADRSDAIPMNALRDLLHQIEDVIDNLGHARDDLLMPQLEYAAELGVRPYTLPGVAATGIAGQAGLTSAAAMRVSEAAVQFVESFTAADGLTLSDRLWRLNQGAKETLARAIGQAVVQGWDASRAAAQFMYSGQPVPVDIAKRLNGSKVDALLRTADLLTGDGGEVWKADRVFRTEINRAHGTAYMQGAEQTPGFGGFRFLLSPRHPKPDVCLRRGTLVTTQRGMVPIEDVAVGDMALTHLGRWRPVVRLYRSASGPSGLVRLLFQEAGSRTRQVVMTPNHPVLTPEGWVPAGDLRTGSAVVCAGPVKAMPHLPGCAGAGHTASQGFVETASTCAAKKTGPAQCGERAAPGRCTLRTTAPNWLWPICQSMSGAAKRLWSCFRPSRLGCFHPCAGQTAIAGIVQSAQTCLDGACQSLGCRPQPSARMQCSNNVAPCCSPLAQTLLGTLRTTRAWLHGVCRNTPWSKTPAFASSVGGVQPAPALGTVGTSWVRGWTWLAPRKHGCRSACSPCATPAQTGWGLAPAVWRSVRRVLGLSYPNHIAFTSRHPIIERLPATGEDVFNLEVADDHSYVANGLVVHNCDLLAEQNLYGLGAGVYPTAADCPWPAHPNTLSFVEMVFADEVSAADRAGKETVTDAMGRMSPDVREGILGVEKSALYDAGQVKPWMIRSPLYAVKQRLARTEKS
jgi:hypothetical protein